MPNIKLDRGARKEVRRFYGMGVKPKQIALFLGVDRSTITRTIKSLGLKPNPVGRPRKDTRRAIT